MGQILFAAAFAAVALYANAIEPRLPRLKRLSLRLPGLLEGWHGAKLALLSDLHAPMIESIRRWVPKALNGEYDLVVVPGDIASRARDVQKVSDSLNSIKSRLGVFATFGNCEYKRAGESKGINAALQRSGIHLMNNGFTKLDRQGDSIWLCGVDDPYTRRDDLSAAAPQASGFKLLLAHAPQVLERPGIGSFGLILCGHTHGGLVRLFGFPLVSHARIEREYSRGLVERPGRPQVFVSQGIGSGRPMVRMFCPPTAYEITLERGKQKRRGHGERRANSATP